MHEVCDTESNRKRVTITLPEDIHAKGQILAKQDRRDFSYFIEVLIEDRLKASVPHGRGTKRKVA